MAGLRDADGPMGASRDGTMGVSIFLVRAAVKPNRDKALSWASGAIPGGGADEAAAKGLDREEAEEAAVPTEGPVLVDGDDDDDEGLVGWGLPSRWDDRGGPLGLLTVEEVDEAGPEDSPPSNIGRFLGFLRGGAVAASPSNGSGGNSVRAGGRS